MNYSIYGFLFSLLFFAASCQEAPSTPPPIPEAYVQQFTVIGGKETILTTESGALLIVPTCAFAEGLEVTLSFTEAYNPADFAALGLTTTTQGGQLLESAGMFRVHTQDQNKRPVFINKPCRLTLRYPVQSVLPNARLYAGKVVDNEIVWSDSGDALSNWLTPAPLDELDLYAERLYQKNANPKAAPNAPKAQFMQPGFDYCGIEDTIVRQLYRPMFQETAIATVEFEERIALLHQSCSSEGLDIYVSNLDRPLYYSDSLVHALLQPTKPGVAQHFYCFYLQKKTTLPQQTSLAAQQLDAWDAFVAQRKRLAERADNRLFYTIPINISGAWYNVDAVVNKNLDAYQFKEDVILSCADLSDAELRGLSVLCLTQKGNSIRKLHYNAELQAHVLGGVHNFTTSKAFTLFAYAQKGDQVYAVSQDITLKETRTKRHLVLAPSTLAAVQRQLAQYGQARPENSLPASWNVNGHACCRVEQRAAAVGM